MEFMEVAKADLPHFKDCPSCSEALPQEAGVNFCPFCGDDLRRVLCPSCSRKLKLNWKFCVGCGTEMEPETDL
jgi:rRNA maturation endonuclease Nob1